MNILVTGGAGYIGSHTLVELIEAGHHPIVVDDFSNSNPESLKRVEKITGQPIEFYKLDLCDNEKTNELFDSHSFEAVIHFAGLKAVGGSVEQPLHYYRTNITSTLSVLEAMKTHDVTKLIFSSSATVYGVPEVLPLTENSQVGVGITNPYGQTKYMIEQIIRDYSMSAPRFEASILRYFNPIGAHSSGLIGEDPSGIPNNLMPYLSQVAIGKREYVGVFGDDYNTTDGTGVRDYVHVVDLAKGHVAALEKSKPGAHAYNLGTGNGTSVLQLISAMAAAAGKEIPYKIMPRRTGDIATNYCDPSKAERDLSWKAHKTLQDMCEDSWRWQSNNPNGYEK
jgi:UDP-glucose 4-epimerase